jgi:membrane protease YdiL (CAAX protease family)
VIWLAAAFVPLLVRAAWTAFVASPPPSLADCGNPFSPVAMLRVAEAALVIGSLAIVALVVGADRESLALRRPSRQVVSLSVAAPLVLVPLALAVGPMLTGPFFGPVPIEVGNLAAIVPAALLALSNAGMEELLFRGAVLGWGAMALGPRAALVLQAVLFGALHAGNDFVDPIAALPVLGAVTVGGLIAGVIVQRTGSLLLPFAVHAALDVPLYYAFACRLPG